MHYPALVGIATATCGPFPHLIYPDWIMEATLYIQEFFSKTRKQHQAKHLYAQGRSPLPLVRLPGQPPAHHRLEPRDELRDPPRPRVLHRHSSRLMSTTLPWQGSASMTGLRESMLRGGQCGRSQLCQVIVLLQTSCNNTAHRRTFVSIGYSDKQQDRSDTSTCASCPARRKTRVFPICQPSRPVVCSSFSGSDAADINEKEHGLPLTSNRTSNRERGLQTCTVAYKRVRHVCI